MILSYLKLKRMYAFAQWGIKQRTNIYLYIYEVNNMLIAKAFWYASVRAAADC
jgi:hypothetical protein